MGRNIICGTALLALAGCGASFSDRAVSGAGLGSAVAAAGTAIVGGPVIAAAAVGAGVGAVAGAVTTPDQIDLGTPVWRQ
jgi:hypothetical protein